MAMSRRRHAKSEVEKALRFAEEHRWRVEVGGSHAWGKMYCPHNSERCRGGVFCITSISGTPKNAGNHARYLMHAVENCVCLGLTETDQK